MATEKTTSANQAPTDADINQAGLLLEAIAGLAHKADRICFLGGILEEMTADDAVSFVDHLRDIICQIGWLADTGAEKIGGATRRAGGAEAWMLPPVYNMATEGVSHV